MAENSPVWHTYLAVLLVGIVFFSGIAFPVYMTITYDATSNPRVSSTTRDITISSTDDWNTSAAYTDNILIDNGTIQADEKGVGLYRTQVYETSDFPEFLELFYEVDQPIEDRITIRVRQDDNISMPDPSYVEVTSLNQTGSLEDLTSFEREYFDVEIRIEKEGNDNPTFNRLSLNYEDVNLSEDDYLVRMIYLAGTFITVTFLLLLVVLVIPRR